MLLEATTTTGNNVVPAVSNAKSAQSPVFEYELDLSLIPNNVEIEFRFEINANCQFPGNDFPGTKISFKDDPKRPAWSFTVDTAKIASSVLYITTLPVENDAMRRSFIIAGSFIANSLPKKTMTIFLQANLSFDWKAALNFFIGFSMAFYTQRLSLRQIASGPRLITSPDLEPEPSELDEEKSSLGSILDD